MKKKTITLVHFPRENFCSHHGDVARHSLGIFLLLFFFRCEIGLSPQRYLNGLLPIQFGNEVGRALANDRRRRRPTTRERTSHWAGREGRARASHLATCLFEEQLFQALLGCERFNFQLLKCHLHKSVPSVNPAPPYFPNPVTGPYSGFAVLILIRPAALSLRSCAACASFADSIA